MWETDVADGEATVAVCGEVDPLTAPELWSALSVVLASAPSQMVIDLSQTTFIDCSGVAVILRAQRHLGGRACEVIIRSPNPTAWKVFAITRVDKVCRIVK